MDIYDEIMSIMVTNIMGDSPSDKEVNDLLFTLRHEIDETEELIREYTQRLQFLSATIAGITARSCAQAARSNI